MTLSQVLVLATIGGCILVPLAMALIASASRRKHWHGLMAGHCPCCGAFFEEDLPDILGRPGADAGKHLDANQKPHAAWLVRCTACGATVCTTSDGFPMKGWYCRGH